MKDRKTDFVRLALSAAIMLTAVVILAFTMDFCGSADNPIADSISVTEPDNVSKADVISESDAVPESEAEIAKPLPEGFSYIDEAILVELRYATEYNFTGAAVCGYEGNAGIMTNEGCAALLAAEHLAQSMGLHLKVYDAYRPQRAVDSFITWVQDGGGQTMKEIFYPNTDKSRLIKDGYLSKKSAHARGSTVDLTLVDAAALDEIDMGSPFDFFDPISHFESGAITAEQQQNRRTLRSIMEQCGFKYYKYEWWHYTLINEPFPNYYFDFVVK